ncbi:hypothetical protein C5167_029234 [Papaver somniferum]|nr:hypothetical protein C5167_029234 [Papaver somniferum]
MIFLVSLISWICSLGLLQINTNQRFRLRYPGTVPAHGGNPHSFVKDGF